MSGEVRLGDEVFVLGASTYNFMLADSGAQGFSSSSPFAPKTTTGPRQYADYDALSELVFAGMVGGMGQERADDPTRYHDAYNVDARSERMVLGPYIAYINGVGSALPTAMWNLLNGLPTAGITGTLGWYPCADYGTKVAAKIHSGAGASKIDRVWLPVKATAWDGAMTLTLHDSDGANGGPGTQIGSSGLVDRRIVRADGVWLSVKLGGEQTVLGNHDYWVVVTMTTPAGLEWYGGYSTASGFSSYANVMAYANGSWGDPADGAHWCLFATASNPATNNCSFANLVPGAGEDNITRVWWWSGRYLFYPGSNGIPVAAVNGATPAAMNNDVIDAVWWQSSADTHPYLYIAQGADGDMTKFDGNVGTEEWATITDIRATFLCVHDKCLWRTTFDNQISGTLDGATFGNAVDLNGVAYDVRGLISWNGSLWAGCRNGLFKITVPTGYPTTGTPIATRVIDFTTQGTWDNCNLLVEHQGDLYFNLGKGLMRYTTGGVLTPITPDVGLDRSASERCVYRAAVSTMGALFVVAEGTPDQYSSILSYSEGRWHPVVSVTTKGLPIRTLCAEPGLYGLSSRLWFDAGLSMAYIDLPFDSQRRWLCGGMTYTPAGHLDFSWADGGIRTIEKDWVSLLVHTDNMTATGMATPKIRCYWRPDEATAWVQVGTDITTNGLHTLDFPAASHSTRLQVRLEIATSDATYATASPHVLAVALRYLERPKDVKAYTRTYEIASNAVWRNGEPCSLALDAQVANLATLRDSAEPLSWYPWWSNTAKNVHIVNYAASERREKQDNPGPDEGTVLVTVKLQEV